MQNWLHSVVNQRERHGFATLSFRPSVKDAATSATYLQ